MNVLSIGVAYGVIAIMRLLGDANCWPRLGLDRLLPNLDIEGESKPPAILAMIDDEVTFADATVDSLAGTVCWPIGIDLDPDVLHGDQTSASAIQPRLLREYRLQQTG